MSLLSVKDLALHGQKVLVRVDFNVPIDENGHILDNSRLEATLPTIRYILSQGGIPILLSHLGRPKGKVDLKYSLSPCAKQLMIMLGRPILMAPDCIGERVEQLVQRLKTGDCLLLENLRFYQAEENPEADPSFARQLAALGNFYVNDAFGTAHRKASSITTIADYFPGRAALGLLMEKEINYLGQALSKPKRPFYGIIGGAKISTKIGVLSALAEKVDTLLIGGAMAYTFLKAQGISIGDSLYEPDFVDEASRILKKFEELGIPLKLPVDHVVINKKGKPEKESIEIVDNSKGIPNGFSAMDIGPKTIEIYAKALENAATIFWNGTLGVYEIERFAEGTRAIANALSKINAIKIVGGGDSIAAIKRGGLAHFFTHLSTGGGASLEFIERGSLPGIEALLRPNEKTASNLGGQTK